MANKGKSSSAMPVIIAVLVVLAVIVVAGLMASGNKMEKEALATAPATSSEEPVARESTASTNMDAVKSDESNPYSARILGNPDAPLKISEHSAFTCPHCKEFHETNYVKIKRDYVDTGKAYIVFNDFPLNQIDMHIGAVARCLPDEVYFNFVQLMFETQTTWAAGGQYVDYVKQNTKLLGLTDEQVDECMNNEDLQKIIADAQAYAYETHTVKSTPTLVLNDSVTIPGLSPYEKLKEKFDEILAATDRASEEPAAAEPEDTPGEEAMPKGEAESESMEEGEAPAEPVTEEEAE